MLNKTLKLLAIVGMLVGVAYLGTCAYANFFMPSKTTGNTPPPPKLESAHYSVTIETNGKVLFTDNFEKYGTIQSTYVLHGYFEQSGREFKFRNHDIILDEKVFGKITVKERG